MAKEVTKEVKEVKSQVSEAIMEPGFLIIKSVLRYGVKPGKDKAFLPPSDFFVVIPGDSGYEVGAEVILKPSARMAPFKDEQETWVVEKTEISCHFPVCSE